MAGILSHAEVGVWEGRATSCTRQNRPSRLVGLGPSRLDELLGPAQTDPSVLGPAKGT
jgi:hypothetical protein